MTTENERLIILDILTEILEKGHYCHLVLRQALDKYGYLPKQDRAFIARVSRGCVEQLLELDAMIDRISNVPTEHMKPTIRNILRMGAYQLKYTEVPAHAVCNEAVKLAKYKGFAGLSRFVNGVLRNLSRRIGEMDFSKSPALCASVPAWLWEAFCSWYGEEKTEQMAAAWRMAQGQGLCVHFHRTKAETKQILESLTKTGVSVSEAPYAEDCYYLTGVDRVGMLEAFQKGWFQVQDIGSALAAQCLSPDAGGACLDICSAPGGKGIWMAESLNGTGIVECRDISLPRLDMIRENKERCGFSNMIISCQDACAAREEDRECFDFVLADVPCSGLGVIAKKPDIKYKVTKKQMEELCVLQRRILEQAAACVRPGGVLVYSTCTINPAENEENVRWLLNTGGFWMESLAPYIKKPVEGADLSTGMMQLLPGQNASDGFFVARLRKRGEKNA